MESCSMSSMKMRKILVKIIITVVTLAKFTTASNSTEDSG